jgi:hypothetical protein
VRSRNSSDTARTRRNHRITFTASTIARTCAVTWWVALVPALIAWPSADAPQNSAYELPTNRQAIAFVLQSIDWYRQTQAELLSLDDNRSIEQGLCQGRNEREPPGRRNWEPVWMMVGWYFGGERALERSGRGLSPPSRVRRGWFSGLQVGVVCGGSA